MIWLKLAAGAAACLLAAHETRAGRTVGQMSPNRLTLIILLLSIGFM